MDGLIRYPELEEKLNSVRAAFALSEYRTFSGDIVYQEVLNHLPVWDWDPDLLDDPKVVGALSELPPEDFKVFIPGLCQVSLLSQQAFWSVCGILDAKMRHSRLTGVEVNVVVEFLIAALDYSLVEYGDRWSNPVVESLIFKLSCREQ